MAARSSSLGSGVISRFTFFQGKVFVRIGLRGGAGIAAAVAALAFVPAGTAHAGVRQAARWWALPQIRIVTGDGLMGTRSPTTFRPTGTLTDQALANLVFGLKQLFAPPPSPLEATPSQTVTDPAQTTTDPTATTTDPMQTTTDPTESTTTTATTTEAVTPPPAPSPPPPPAQPPRVAHGAAAASMTMLDAQLVDGVGLDAAAAEFARGARAAGLVVPARFGTEVAARLLGLRTDHPAREDFLELLPDDPATRSEAAYSAAQLIHTSGWLVPIVQHLADTFSLPHYSKWQRRILDTAVARIGMPYVWGGTNDGAEVDFGVAARGGYDCSGFVWRVYKLTRYPGERDLASVLRGRTTYVMSGEVPRSQLVNFAHLQPADVLFFGARGPRSRPSQVDHMGIYLGNGWFIQSSEYGVAVAQLTGRYRRKFAWARRPLREAGLSG
jgi:cell wall-associated NlpC family hydrolase